MSCWFYGFHSIKRASEEREHTKNFHQVGNECIIYHLTMSRVLLFTASRLFLFHRRPEIIPKLKCNSANSRFFDRVCDAFQPYFSPSEASVNSRRTPDKTIALVQNEIKIRTPGKTESKTSQGRVETHTQNGEVNRWKQAAERAGVAATGLPRVGIKARRLYWKVYFPPRSWVLCTYTTTA